MERPNTWNLSYEEFQSLLHTSAQQYLDHLDLKFKAGDLTAGHKVVNVYQMRPGVISCEWILQTSEKIVFPDACEIWVNGKYEKTIEVSRQITFGPGRHGVALYDRENRLRQIPDLMPEDILIISDMRHLITKLDRFYTSRQLSFSPPSPQDLPPLQESLLATLSAEQLEAVDAVHSSPIVFVNGAPGTGKTRAVMSRCVLRYFFAEKRVLLMAPTNNAVEQMLRGILPVLQECGVDLEKVYRIGASSDRFAKEYPQVVGDTALESLLLDLQRQKQFLQEQLRTAKDAEAKLPLFLDRLEKCRTAHARVLALIPELRSVRAEQLALRDPMIQLKNDLAAHLAKKKQLADKKKAAQQILDSFRALVNSKSRQLDRIPPFFWNRKKRRLLENELSQMFNSLFEREADCKNAEKAVQDNTSTIEAVSSQLNTLYHRHTDLTGVYSSISAQMLYYAQTDPDYLQVIKQIPDSRELSTAAAEAFISDLEKRCDELKKVVSESPAAPLVEELSKIEAQSDELGKNAKLRQRREALVLAGTVDALARDFPDSQEEKKIHHVFLDEAGYTSLARGIVAFGPGAPVAFFGDHKQLPPVCEMSSIPPEQSPVCLWSLPVVYLSELLTQPFHRVYSSCYLDGDEPSFDGVTACWLSTSYRFGPDLARILGRYIYSLDFTGLSATPLEVTVLHANEASGPAKWTNPAEVQAVVRYLRGVRPDDVGILCPYRNQAKMLWKSVPKQYQDCVFTVHRSQGNEFDTVILSITSNSFPFLVDSDTKKGRTVLNTAVSRTKRKLVLVCDTSCWIHRHDQMITELIQIEKSAIFHPNA